MTGEYVRQVPMDPGTLTVVGVVHDHPASTYRVRRVVEHRVPDVLALELPPLAIPLFEQYARDEREPPVFGGEMSAAVQAADTDSVVGIDRPTGTFFRQLARRLLEERPSLPVVRNVLSNAVSTTGHAIVCRLAAVVAARTSVRVEVDSPVAHDTDWRDAADDQARDERRQIRKSRAFMNAFRSASGPSASRVEDAVREEHMADQLAAHRGEGDVVAVVGIDHLDPLVERVSDTWGAGTETDG